MQPEDLLEKVPTTTQGVTGPFVSEGVLILITRATLQCNSSEERRWDPYGSGLPRSQLAARW